MEQQEIIFRLSMMEQQISQMREQLQAVESGIAELDKLGTGLNEIPKSVGKEILAQIGKGIYAKAKITSDELMVNIGDGNFVNRSAKDTKELIDKQSEKLRGIGAELEDNLEKASADFRRMIEEYQNSN